MCLCGFMELFPISFGAVNSLFTVPWIPGSGFYSILLFVWDYAMGSVDG